MVGLFGVRLKKTAVVVILVTVFTGIFILIAISGGYTTAYKEGLAWLNVNSDDMLSYTDGADANITNQIKWKIRGCSTITKNDLNIAVANAKRAQQIEDSANSACKNG